MHQAINIWQNLPFSTAHSYSYISIEINENERKADKSNKGIRERRTLIAALIPKKFRKKGRRKK